MATAIGALARRDQGNALACQRLADSGRLSCDGTAKPDTQQGSTCWVYLNGLRLR